MRTGLTKREKTTAIYFDELGDMIEVQTHNTGLKGGWIEFADIRLNALKKLAF